MTKWGFETVKLVFKRMIKIKYSLQITKMELVFVELSVLKTELAFPIKSVITPKSITGQA